MLPTSFAPLFLNLTPNPPSTLSDAFTISLKLADEVAQQPINYLFSSSGESSKSWTLERLRSLCTTLTWLSDLQSKELESERTNKQSSSTRIENLLKNFKKTKDAADLMRVRSTHAAIDECMTSGGITKILKETTERWAAQRSSKVGSDYCITSLLLKAIEKSSSLDPTIERGLLDARVTLLLIASKIAFKGNNNESVKALQSLSVLNPDLIRAGSYLALIETEVDAEKGAKGLALLGESWTKWAFSNAAPRFLRDPYFILGLLLRSGHQTIALNLCVDMNLIPSKLDEAKILLRTHSNTTTPRLLALSRQYANHAKTLADEDGNEWLLELFREVVLNVWRNRGSLYGDLEILSLPLLNVLECEVLEKIALSERGAEAAGFVASLRLAYSRSLPLLPSTNHAPSTRVEALMMIRQKSDAPDSPRKQRKTCHTSYFVESSYRKESSNEYDKADAKKFEAAMQPREMLKREHLHKALTQRPKMELADFRMEQDSIEEEEEKPSLPKPNLPVSLLAETPMQSRAMPNPPTSSKKFVMNATTTATTNKNMTTTASLRERLAASNRVKAVGGTGR